MKEGGEEMNLAALIEASGKTQAEVARAIGTRPQYLNAVIKGRRPLPIKWIEPLCKELHCDPNTLFGWEDIITPENSGGINTSLFAAKDIQSGTGEQSTGQTFCGSKYQSVMF